MLIMVDGIAAVQVRPAEPFGWVCDARMLNRELNAGEMITEKIFLSL